MYKRKSDKYNNKLKQLGGLVCPFSISELVYIPTLKQTGFITKLNYVLDGNVTSQDYPHKLIQRDEEPDEIKDLPNICINARINNMDISIRGLRKIDSLTKKEFIDTGYDVFDINTLSYYFNKYFTLVELIAIYNLNNAHVNESLANYQFDFYKQPIPETTTLAEFRTIFPLAIGINLTDNTVITDTEFIAHILPRFKRVIAPNRKRILKVNISRTRLTDAAFGILNTWIHTLDMSYCNQPTDTAFTHLGGIYMLDMSYCDQVTITDAAFTHLVGINTLYMHYCYQNTITNQAFVNLVGIHTLVMSRCNQMTITDDAFVHLAGIHTLDIHGCKQTTITDNAFVHLKGIHTLNMRECRQLTITDAAFVHLAGIHTLEISGCNQLTDAAFAHITGIHNLYMTGCRQRTITDQAFTHLTGIYALNISNCNQPTITGNGFCLLESLKFLDIYGCNQQTIAKANQVFGVSTGNTVVQRFTPCT